MTIQRRHLYGAAGLAVICWARLCAAYRPFDGTDAELAEPGEVELELGPAGYRRQGSSQFVVAPALVANYGFAPGFEAVLEGRQDIPISATTHLWQVQDAALSVKALLRRGSLQGCTGVSVALEAGILLPGLEDGLGTHIGSIFSVRLPALSLHLNLGNDLYSARYEASASLILEGPASWRLRPVAEMLVERDFGSSVFSHGLGESALLGGIVRWSDPLAFDLGLRYGRADGQSQEEVRAGLTWAFGLW